MQQLNNLDVIILIVVGISALIALSRGLIKEVLSIIGWVLGTISIVYLLPILNPITSMYIESGAGAAIVTSLFILIIFFIAWIMLTGSVIGKVRKSKLSGIDRVLGLFFGIFRAFLLVALFYIMVNWVVPKDKQSEVFTQSKYFQIAGSFAQPLEALIPEATLANIREKTKSASGLDAEDKEGAEGEEKPKKKTDVDILFEMLSQPKIAKDKKEDKPIAIIPGDFSEKAKAPAVEKAKETKSTEETPAHNDKSYNEHERDNLDRLIENTLQ